MLLSAGNEYPLHTTISQVRIVKTVYQALLNR
jgi:hypothetical protein